MRLLTVLTAIYLAAMPAALASDPKPPPRPLPKSVLVIDTEHGPVKFTVEVANDPQSQEYGLMYRKSLPPNGGMLFDFHRTVMTSFWMKNTLIPLDMLFIRTDGTISSIAPDAVPLSHDTIPSTEPVQAVLEIIGGRAAQLGIYPGDRVHYAAFGTAAK